MDNHTPADPDVDAIVIDDHAQFGPHAISRDDLEVLVGDLTRALAAALPLDASRPCSFVPGALLDVSTCQVHNRPAVAFGANDSLLCATRHAFDVLHAVPMATDVWSPPRAPKASGAPNVGLVARVHLNKTIRPMLDYAAEAGADIERHPWLNALARMVAPNPEAEHLGIDRITMWCADHACTAHGAQLLGWCHDPNAGVGGTSWAALPNGDLIVVQHLRYRGDGPIANVEVLRPNEWGPTEDLADG